MAFQRLAAHDDPDGSVDRDFSGMGAMLRWCSCNRSSTPDHAAAGIAQAGAGTVLAWESDAIPEYSWCVELMLTVAGADGLIRMGLVF